MVIRKVSQNSLSCRVCTARPDAYRANKHAAILSLRTRSIRRFYAVVSNMLPGFLRVCLPIGFFLLLSSSFAALSFGRAKSEFEDPASAGYSIW